MQFIRRQRTDPNHDPNTKHVLYGLDADLIMLGLATHEPHFTILREEVLFGRKRKTQGYKVDEETNVLTKKKPFDLLSVWILREYLQHEFAPEAFSPMLPFEYDFERCIDDFVFLCFFVGNDFLPHLPSLSIREGGLELLLSIYKSQLAAIGGYLTQDGEVKLERVDIFLGHLGSVEDEIFRRRRVKDQRQNQRRAQQKMQREQNRKDARTTTSGVRANRTKFLDSAPDFDPSSLVAIGVSRLYFYFCQNIHLLL